MHALAHGGHTEEPAHGHRVFVWRSIASPTRTPTSGCAFVTDGEPRAVPKHRLATGPLDARAAYQIVHDELMLDGNARLNLATFVTTWMEPQAGR